MLSMALGGANARGLVRLFGMVLGLARVAVALALAATLAQRSLAARVPGIAIEDTVGFVFVFWSLARETLDTVNSTSFLVVGLRLRVFNTDLGT